MSRISIYSVYTSTYKRDVGCCCFFCIAVHLFNVSIVKKKKKFIKEILHILRRD